MGNGGVEVDPNKVEAISEMKAPTDIFQLRRFLGVVNQVGGYVENLANLTQPLRSLLNKNSGWLWGMAQQQAFDKIKKKLQHWQYTTPREKPKSLLMHHHLDWERS